MYLITEITKVIPYQRVTNKAEIIISGSRVTARVPDLIVLTPEGAAELAQYKRSTITLDMPPLLVVEVVSPGKQNRDKPDGQGLRPDARQRAKTRSVCASLRDYRFKRSEYAARGISYYWIIDPQDKKFVCLELVDGLYEEVSNDSQKVIFKQRLELKIELEKIFFD